MQLQPLLLPMILCSIIEPHDRTNAVYSRPTRHLISTPYFVCTLQDITDLQLLEPAAAAAGQTPAGAGAAAAATAAPASRAVMTRGEGALVVKGVTEVEYHASASGAQEAIEAAAKRR